MDVWWDAGAVRLDVLLNDSLQLWTQKRNKESDVRSHVRSTSHGSVLCQDTLCGSELDLRGICVFLFFIYDRR